MSNYQLLKEDLVSLNYSLRTQDVEAPCYIIFTISLLLYSSYIHMFSSTPYSQIPSVSFVLNKTWCQAIPVLCVLSLLFAMSGACSKPPVNTHG